MNPGELKERIAVLTLEGEDNTYSWGITGNTCAKVEHLKGANIFSSIGLSAKSIKFTIRRRPLTLHNAFRWDGRHCFLTEIVDVNHKYYEVTAALVEPLVCIVERQAPPTLDDLNRPVYSPPVEITFPACLTEKYLERKQEEPMAVSEIRYVLVTPKAVDLISGEIVLVGEQAYTVETLHILDPYKNEFEISLRRDS